MSTTCIGNNVSQALSNAVVDGVGVRKTVVRSNKIHDNAVGSHGIFFKGGSSKILIEKNDIYGIRQNAAVQLGGNTGPKFLRPELVPVGRRQPDCEEQSRL